MVQRYAVIVIIVMRWSWWKLFKRADNE